MEVKGIKVFFPRILNESINKPFGETLPVERLGDAKVGNSDNTAPTGGR